jgi:hypothetical protein
VFVPDFLEFEPCKAEGLDALLEAGYIGYPFGAVHERLVARPSEQRLTPREFGREVFARTFDPLPV